MSPLEVIAAKRAHMARLTNESGAEGEQQATFSMDHWVPRPKGMGLRVLLEELRSTDIFIKASSFDALSLPYPVDFEDRDQVKGALPQIVFIEIKSASQARVKPDFTGFFFALTESEISAADQLGKRHRVALYNKITEEISITSVSEILVRAKSTNWQVSVQL